MVRCPKCGFEFHSELPRQKGTGKKTGTQQTRLGMKQMWVLRVLGRLDAKTLETACTRQQIYETMRNEAVSRNERIPSSHIVGFWLSALLGAGFVTMTNRKCELRDYETRDIRFKKKPVWYLSEGYQNGRLGFTEEGVIVKEVGKVEKPIDTWVKT